ncbi:MAG: DUF3300 domain-containing protein [Rudaea sp.]|nr:DUF3300 domain-containing protein [Rudaea sp.]
MKTCAKYLVFSLLLVLVGAFAQDATPPAGDNPSFSQEELDQMLAPIALYPDPLLSQILMAATYPLEVVQAARWSGAHPDMKGDAAVQAVADQNWDPSIKALIAFPQVLQTLDQKIEWTERLGDAFLAQQSQVMDTVQQLRRKAQQAGNLNSNAQIAVNQADDAIEIAPSNPDEVYVPYYDPNVIYGSWWWPGYPPVFWSPWPGYGWNGGFAWGIGIGIGADFFFGSWDWRHHLVFAGGGHGGEGRRPWQHDPGHRRGVPYRSGALNQRFGRAPAASAEFRGNPGFGGRGGRLPSLSALNGRLDSHEPMQPRNAGRPSAEPRAHAFENVGRGSDARNFSARGHASSAGRQSASRPEHH